MSCYIDKYGWIVMDWGRNATNVRWTRVYTKVFYIYTTYIFMDCYVKEQFTRLFKFIYIMLQIFEALNVFQRICVTVNHPYGYFRTYDQVRPFLSVYFLFMWFLTNSYIEWYIHTGYLAVTILLIKTPAYMCPKITVRKK